MLQKRKCLNCNADLVGRSDKKFCDQHCKSAFHYNKVRAGQRSFYARIDKQLKKNRRLLKIYNKGGKATVRSEILLAQGFNPRFFTHSWTSKSGNEYLFVYEYGFFRRIENGKEKYVLITWQPYMYR